MKRERDDEKLNRDFQFHLDLSIEHIKVRMADRNISSSMDDLTALEPASKRPYEDSEENSSPSLNQKALDVLLFDWSKNSIPNTTIPDWNYAITALVANERPKVPVHPKSAFEQFQHASGDE